MKTKNSTQLIGYLGKDPVIRECKNGRMLAVLRIATDKRIRKEEAVTYKPIWHNVAIWGDLVNSIGNIMKGSHVMIEGQLEYQTYINKKGEKRHVTEINAYSFTDLDR